MQFAVNDSTSRLDGFFDFLKALANAAAVKDDGAGSSCTGEDRRGNT
jgi:hypothetical protein